VDGPQFVDGEAVELGPEPRDLLPQRAGAATGTAVAPAHRVESPFAPRFQFLTGVLIAVGVASVALMVALALAPGRTQRQGPDWSPWRPTEQGPAGAVQIAGYVSRQYRLPGRRQLVAVTGGPLEAAGLPLTVALRQSPSQGGNIELIEGDGVLYRLCGLGEKCSIPYGKPSRRRHLLLRREALELALYSFRYLDGVDDVAVFMPPPPGQDPKQALFFRRADLRAQLQAPLRATLPRPVPSLHNVTASPNARFVNELTTSTLFQFSLTQANQDDRAFLVLEPFDEPAR
jgi:hypothetical protein